MPEPMPTEYGALLAAFLELQNRREHADDLWLDWMVGVVGGGPGGDGRYPLVNRAGVEVLRPCPDQMAAQFLGISYQAQIGFAEALGSAEQFATLLMPAAIRFTDNFAGAIGKLRGELPIATLQIDVRHYLANLTGGSVVGTITIATNRAVTFTTAGTGDFDVAAGDQLVFQGPVTALAATHFVAVLKGQYL